MRPMRSRPSAEHSVRTRRARLLVCFIVVLHAGSASRSHLDPAHAQPRPSSAPRAWSPHAASPLREIWSFDSGG